MKPRPRDAVQGDAAQDTPLMRCIRERIALNGPMGVAAYMDLCLNDPDHGYYATRRPIGAAGDFTTAPEVSQMFGELIAMWAAAVWQASGRPPVALVEIGPGRGTLMRDMARAVTSVSGFAPALHLVETSRSLTKQQRETLGGTDATWHVSVEETRTALADMPAIWIANELLDALPVEQFVRRGDGWHDRTITTGEKGLAFAIGEPADVGCDAPDGTVLERSAPREAMVRDLARDVASHGIAALFFDYGSFTGGTGDTLQAVARHRRVDPLATPGEADLTSHVDFAALAAIACEEGCEVETTSQGALLLRLGLLERAGRLGASADEAVRERLRGEVERLAAPAQMGELFKVMALRPAGTPPPPGFHDEVPR